MYTLLWINKRNFLFVGYVDAIQLPLHTYGTQ